jgi:hypothetical protein
VVLFLSGSLLGTIYPYQKSSLGHSEPFTQSRAGLGHTSKLERGFYDGWLQDSQDSKLPRLLLNGHEIPTVMAICLGLQASPYSQELLELYLIRKTFTKVSLSGTWWNMTSIREQFPHIYKHSEC